MITMTEAPGPGTTGLRLHHAYVALVRSRCPLRPGVFTSHCYSLMNAYSHAAYPLPSGDVLTLLVGLSVIPVLVGVFAGAPLLAREHEAGTFRFAWTQAASRTRWVAAKLTLLGVTLTVAAGAFGALVSWWLVQARLLFYGSRWEPAQFGLTPVTFAGWTLLAFALGAFAGALIRRTVPAMAATAVCLTVLAAVTYKRLDGMLVSLHPVRGHAVLLNQTIYGSGADPITFLSGMAVVTSSPAGSWPLLAWIAGPRGQAPAAPALNTVLGLTTPLAQNRWLASHHLTLWITYQPAGRYWLLQSAEGGCGLLLALALGAATVWLVRRWAA
jgi:hypothetical protein